MSEAVQVFVEAWEALHEMPVPGDAVSVAAWRNRRRVAATDVASARLPRITVPLVSFDWDRLRVNVMHLVEPRLVTWR